MALNVFNPVDNSPFIQTCYVTIKPIEAEGITLDQKEVSMKGGEKFTLTAKATPENTTNLNLLWKSSNSKVAIVSKDGQSKDKAIVTAIGEGETTITAYVSGNSKVYAECKIKVSPTKLEGLSLKETEKAVIQGETFTLSPIFTPEQATNKNITWSSSDEQIATVDKNGNVSTVHFGECIIKAISEDGGFEAISKVTVKPIPVEKIGFKEYSYKVEIGGTKQLNVTIVPDNAGNKKIKWSSSNPVIAPIDENGVVRGNTQGNVTITATSEDGNHTATCTLYVVEISSMMNVYFPSSSVVIRDGFYSGVISCAIRNNSSQSVKLTRFWVIDTNTYNTVAETTDESLLGKELAPGQTISLSGRFNSVYEPAFCWGFEHNGRTFNTYTRYGDRSTSPFELKSVGKADVQVPLRRVE